MVAPALSRRPRLAQLATAPAARLPRGLSRSGCDCPRHDLDHSAPCQPAFGRAQPERRGPGHGLPAILSARTDPVWPPRRSCALALDPCSWPTGTPGGLCAVSWPDRPPACAWADDRQIQCRPGNGNRGFGICDHAGFAGQGASATRPLGRTIPGPRCQWLGLRPPSWRVSLARASDKLMPFLLRKA